MQIFIKLQNNKNEYIITLHQNHETNPTTVKQNKINTRTPQQDNNPGNGPKFDKNSIPKKLTTFVPK